VYLMADGPFGREAFRIELPGRPLIVRSGWLALRRQTGVPALPVLTFREGGRRVIVVHPPLPAPDADRARDAAACRAALTPLVADYVRRFPAQCRYLVFPPWLAEATAPRP
jgi:lauroyl/myristoyl acyltransferase